MSFSNQTRQTFRRPREHGDFTIAITKADVRVGGRITGAFSGKMIDEDGATASTTNGVFDLPIE